MTSRRSYPARRAARGAAVPRRRGVRARRHRVRPVGAARARHARGRLRPYPALAAGSRGCRASRHRRGSRYRRRSLNSVVDAAWLAEHLGEDDLVVGDVRGPNAHMRGHIPGSRPLVLGSPPPGGGRSIAARARAARSCCGCGGTGSPAASGSCSSTAATASARCRRRSWPSSPAIRSVVVLLGGMAAWEGASRRASSSSCRCARRQPSSSRTRALPDAEGDRRPARRPALTPRHPAPDEYTGRGGSPCDPRQGHIPGAKHVEVASSSQVPGRPSPPERIRELVGAARGSRGRRILPLWLALRARDARTAQRRLRRAQLLRLVARMDRHDELPIKR